MPEPAFTLPGIRVHLPRNRCSRSPESVFTMLWNGCSPSAGICVHDAPEYAVDRFVPLSERHLRTAVTEYVVHYHTERNHQGLGNELLTPLPASANDAGPIVSRERLGGILNYYCRAA